MIFLLNIYAKFQKMIEQFNYTLKYYNLFTYLESFPSVIKINEERSK